MSDTPATSFQVIPLDQLHAHPSNSNVMPEPMVAKLVEHIGRTDRYPPLIVRPHDAGYQVLDGHHRAEALRRLNQTEARCVVWDVGDDEALVLLATLNRLQGRDDPRKRASLVEELQQHFDVDTLASLLPEDADALQKLVEINHPPQVREPLDLEDMPLAVHFFLRLDQRTRLERRLHEVGPNREEALLRCVLGGVKEGA
ncbi:MAG: hypothetical protein GC164_02720 [Phycisphaera sp.]|nr:hypothetical protein [Phycisphaera sp.]